MHTLTYGDPEAPHRQLGIVDRRGRVGSYTGSRCLPWAGGMCGRSFAVQGNLLAGPQVVEAMADSYEAGAGASVHARGSCAALVAGDEAGGDRRGRQSAALKVWRAEPTRTPGDVPPTSASTTRRCRCTGCSSSSRSGPTTSSRADARRYDRAPMAVRAFLFDFDGLLVDTETASRAGWELLYREHGHELPPDNGR